MPYCETLRERYQAIATVLSSAYEQIAPEPEPSTLTSRSHTIGSRHSTDTHSHRSDKHRGHHTHGSVDTALELATKNTAALSLTNTKRPPGPTSTPGTKAKAKRSVGFVRSCVEHASKTDSKVYRKQWKDEIRRRRNAESECLRQGMEPPPRVVDEEDMTLAKETRDRRNRIDPRSSAHDVVDGFSRRLAAAAATAQSTPKTTITSSGNASLAPSRPTATTAKLKKADPARGAWVRQSRQ